MWDVVAEGSKEEIYELLKQKFDEQVVEKEEYVFTSAATRVHSELTHVKERAVIDDTSSAQFRLMLKSVQSLVALYDGNVHVELHGNSDDEIISLEIRAA